MCSLCEHTLSELTDYKLTTHDGSHTLCDLWNEVVGHAFLKKVPLLQGQLQHQQ